MTTSGTHRGGGSTHAWCNVYLPGAGWMEYDPTNGLIAGSNLVRVGVARSAAQALPVSGGYIGEPEDFDRAQRGCRGPRRADLTRRASRDWGARVSSDRSERGVPIRPTSRPGACLARRRVDTGDQAHERFRVEPRRLDSDVYPALAKRRSRSLRPLRVRRQWRGLCERRLGSFVLDHERVEAVRVRPRLRGSGRGGRAPAHRRQRDRPAVQLARGDRAN